MLNNLSFDSCWFAFGSTSQLPLYKDNRLSIIYRDYNMISSKSGGNIRPIGLEYSGKLLLKTIWQQQHFFICMIQYVTDSIINMAASVHLQGLIVIK